MRGKPELFVVLLELFGIFIFCGQALCLIREHIALESTIKIGNFPPLLKKHDNSLLACLLVPRVALLDVLERLRSEAHLPAVCQVASRFLGAHSEPVRGRIE